MLLPNLIMNYNIYRLILHLLAYVGSSNARQGRVAVKMPEVCGNIIRPDSFTNSLIHVRAIICEVNFIYYIQYKHEYYMLSENDVPTN